MKYGVNNVGKVECKKHQEMHAADERCRWCEPEPFKSMTEDLQPEHAYVAGMNGWFWDGYTWLPRL